MDTAKNGDTVRVHYTGKLEDGTVFDSSRKTDPLEFTIGDERLISGFEEAVVGMAAGDTKTIEIAPEDGYGPHRNELVFQLEREKLPDHLDPEVGQQLEFVQPDGQKVRLTITDLSAAAVTLDANHPLAGKDLTFDVELVEIVADS